MNDAEKMKNRKVKFRRLNWDACFYSDLLKGNAFIISEPAELSFDGQKKKALYGAQSPLYGTSYEDEQSFAERYRCGCLSGGIKGRIFEGEICPICGQPVEYKDSDITITGWISLGDNKIISPYYYRVFQSAIGKTVFPDIINARIRIDKDGNESKPDDEDYDYKPSSIYAGIGFNEFYKRYEEIIYYFMETKKNKQRTLELLLKQKRNVFVSHIPIPSTMLRPQSTTQNTIYFNTIDKCINTTFSLSENIKNCIDVEKEYILQRLQTRVNEMWDIYFDTLNLKDGFIRGEIMGGSLN